MKESIQPEKVSGSTEADDIALSKRLEEEDKLRLFNSDKICDIVKGNGQSYEFSGYTLVDAKKR